MTSGGDPRALVEGALAEIDEEVARQRNSGALGPGYEEKMDREFKRLSPGAGSADQGLRRSIADVQQQAVIDPQVPVASRRPAGSFAKRLVRAAVGWYIRFFVSQISKFAMSVARALALVSEDLERLHRQVAALEPPVPAQLVPGDVGESPWWGEAALSCLSGATRPVLQAECGSRAALLALRAAGVDAYRLDEEGVAGEGAARASEVTSDSMVRHIRSLPPGSLGGAILDGSVQWFGPAACEEIVSLLSTRLERGGTLLVVSSTPASWERSADPVLRDIAPHRPLHPETWSYLLGRSGFRDVEVRSADDLGEYLVAAVCEGGR